MTGVPWSERLVEVIADLGPAGFRYGSGCVVAGKTVLTAAHVIVDASGVTIRDTYKRSYPAKVDAEFVGSPEGPAPDFALLQVDDLPGDGFPPLALGRAVRDSQTPVVIERCHAFGYPGFAETSEPRPARDSVHAVGVIAPLSKLSRGLLSMVVSLEPATLGPQSVSARSGESPWSGMSGGPVVADERLLGVVVEHALAEGSSTVTVLPLTALEADPDRPRWGPGVPDPAGWWRRLGAVDGPAHLQPVPAPSATHAADLRKSAYESQVERIAPAELLGRAEELDELSRFCTQPDSETYRWLRAGAWAGKSALMSWFVLHPPPGIRVVSFFVTARFARQDDRVAFAEAVLEQTLALLGQPVPPLLTETTRDAHLLAKLNEAAAVCRARGERLVLVVDGLDEDRGTDGFSIAALLPERPVAGMRIIVTGRPNPPLPPDVSEHHPLRDATTVRPLIQSPHAASTRTITQQEVKRLLADPADRDLLGFIATAGGGLTALDLAELTDRLAWQVQDRLHATAGRTFGTRAGIWQREDTYVLGHEELQNSTVDLLGGQAQEDYRRRLHLWADTYRRRGWPENTPDYLLQGYLSLLQTGDDVTRLVGLVTDPARQDRLLARSGADSATMAELTMAQDLILGQDVPDVTAMATVAVHRDVLVRRNRSIPAELPMLWAQLNLFARAEALAQSISDEEERAEAMRLIAAATETTSSMAPDPAAAALPAATRWAPVVGTTNDDAGLMDDAGLEEDVHALIAVAQRVSGAGERWFDAAEVIACAVQDPELRVNLWNSILWARGSAVAPRESSAPSDSVLAAAFPPAQLSDRVARRFLAMGDLDRAEAVTEALQRHDPWYGYLADVVETAVREGDTDRAERIALGPLNHEHRSGVPNHNRSSRVLNRLVETVVATGAPARAEVSARTLCKIDGDPTALVSVGVALWETGRAEHARRLLDEALEAVMQPRYFDPWPSEDTFADVLLDEALEAETQPRYFKNWLSDAFADVLRAMAKVGNLERAVTAAGACQDDTTRQRALLTVAEAAADCGDDEIASALATDVVREVAKLAKAPEKLLYDAVGLLARLGRADEALAEAQAFADPELRKHVLARVVADVLDADDLGTATELCGRITDPTTRTTLLPGFLRAHLRAHDHPAALAVAQSLPDSPALDEANVAALVQAALVERAFDVAEVLVTGVRQPDAQVRLRMSMARAAVAAAHPERARELLEAAEAAVRSSPDPEWRAAALTAAARALVQHGDADRMAMLVQRAEAAADQILDPAARSTALTDVAAVVMVSGDAVDADRIFEEAARAFPIPCTQAERLASTAMAAADRGHPVAARRQVAALSRLTPWITDPHNRLYAEQARLTAAIHIGDLGQAEAAACAIEHPDQRALALTDVARALTLAGQPGPATTLALTITIPDRQADALTDVARMAAARGDFAPAERAAHAITLRSAQAPALVAIAWESARSGDLVRAERIVAAIADPGWQQIGLSAVHDQRSTQQTTASEQRPRTAAPPPATADTDTPPEKQAEALLRRADSTPDDPSAVRLLVEALRISPCPSVLASLSRVAPAAARSAADTLLALLR
ncbi:trypsin-like peptidase domain-containing protein [Streptomyces sp. IBSBF 3352]|uniref:trypsin-like peptidase domain-containing protein n=1 Tax=Streptomyces sp. IBSBF 3352 TaxID=2903523 RepID=UPI002FDC3531